MNKVYEYGGIADILLRFKIDKEVSGINYAANEPYTFLKDVDIQFNYEQINGQGAATKPIFASNAGRPTQLIISGVPLTQKIANLILTNNNDKTCNRTRREKIVCYESGILNLNYALSGAAFAYNNNMDRIQCSQKDNSLIGDFISHEEYLVFYDEEIIGDKYSFEIPHFPYFKLEVFMKGNTNKITNNIYMRFDAASLASVPNFNITSGGILNTPLVFNIIYINQEEPIIVFEE